MVCSFCQTTKQLHSRQVLLMTHFSMEDYLYQCTFINAYCSPDYGKKLSVVLIRADKNYRMKPYPMVLWYGLKVKFILFRNAMMKYITCPNFKMQSLLFELYWLANAKLNTSPWAVLSNSQVQWWDVFSPSEASSNSISGRTNKQMHKVNVWLNRQKNKQKGTNLESS